MLYLVFAILASSLVSIVMRLTKTRVKNEQSLLAVNYLVCLLIGGAYMGFENALPQGAGGAWPIGLGAATGALYLLGFVLLQYNVGKNGVVLSSTFMKLGLLVPIVCAIVFLGEMPETMQVIGFVLAIAAVLLMNGGTQTAARSRGTLVLLLLTCGTGDFMSKVYETLGPKAMSDQFLFYTFVFAFSLCLIPVIRKREKPGIKELLWGAALGLPNYFSARFILGALGEGIPAVIVYPTFSVATVVVLLIAGVVLFKEKLSRREWIGIGMILTALVFLNI